MKLQGRTRKMNRVFQRNGEVSTPNILARKSERGLLPYCKIGAKSEGNNRPGPLVSVINFHCEIEPANLLQYYILIYIYIYILYYIRSDLFLYCDPVESGGLLKCIFPFSNPI
jgi:hypothetical protein